MYPNGDGKRDIPDFTERYVEWVWRAYLDTGDRRLLTDLYPVCKRIVAYLASAIPSEPPGTGLVTDLPGGDGAYLHGIVDWPVAMRYGYDVATAARTTENALAVEAFARVGDMARALKRPAGETSLQDRRAGSLRAAMVRRLERCRRGVRRRAGLGRCTECARIAARERVRARLQHRAARPTLGARANTSAVPGRRWAR